MDYGYLLLDINDPVNIVPVVLVLFCFVWCGVPHQAGAAKWSAWWVLFNACIIHIWMEWIIGVCARGPRWMVDQYGILDTRYWKTKDPTVMVICHAELLIMGPLSILWYNAILKKLWYRHFVAIVVSSFQMFGAIIYAFSEVLLGLQHLPLNSPSPYTGSWNDIFYFWVVFVFGNIVWTAIPTLVILNSVFAFRPNDGSHKKRD